MSLPAIQFHALPSPSHHSYSSSSSPFFSFFFPIPVSKILIPKSTKAPKFLVRCSAADTKTLPKSAIKRIAEKLRSLGFTEETQTEKPDSESAQANSAGEIFVPLPQRLPNYRVGHTIDSSWSSPVNPVPRPGSGTAILRYNELNNEVKKQKELQRELEKETGKKREERVPTLAELSLSGDELKRLRALGIQLKQKLKVGKAGITEGIVNGIHERWRRSEVVKIVCDDICRVNMKRTHDLLERKTGGLVVWRSGTKIILYRGTNYKYPYFLSNEDLRNDDDYDGALRPSDSDNEGCDKAENFSTGINSVTLTGQNPNLRTAKPTLVQGVGAPNKVRFQMPGEAELAEGADRLLMGLGPRFTDWWGYDPPPVDADLLPAVIPGYRKPFRLLPYGLKPKLTDDEMTILKRLGRPLPCHFALGRNRKLQGLAAAINKLWERCEIAKIAIKRGVQNTNSEMMAEELKQLTGGTLLSRDREFIVLYRGKDFLPLAVSSAIEERRNSGMDKKKLKVETSPGLNRATVVPEGEGSDAISLKSTPVSGQRKPTELAIKRTSIKLSMALEKKSKAEKLLAELEKAENREEPETDKEGITEEERYMLRKIGLKMSPFLLLGRRGVFAGTVENMHLHWKYRELVKIICKEKSLEAVHQIARTLEAESGGILVAIERVNKGNAIIVYRGKNYSRPDCLRPRTLLNKRQAMKRSIEEQRRQSLKLHVLKLNKNIDELKLQLAVDKEANRTQITDARRSELMEEEKMGTLTNGSGLTDELKSTSGSSFGPALQELQQKARGKQGTYSADIDLKSDKEGSVDVLQATQQFQPTDDDGPPEGESESLSGSMSEDTQMDGASGSVIVDSGHHVSKDEAMESSVTSSKSDSESTSPVMNKMGLNEFSSRSLYLSNRERLLLRKQALKMRKRPVLAVGKNNIVTGVAKTIKAHFRKHPLAIVNIKGRAKGTSVQEVVFELQQATGAVLVSREPNKVILYRGWGKGEKPGTEMNINNMGKEGGTKPSVSPELLEAIRVECGLQ